MRAIHTIAWKDIKNLLTSPLFFIIAGLCTVLWSYTFIRNIMQFAESSRQNMGTEGGMNLQREVFMLHISQINLLFVFVVPALTMRLLAEEKRLRTYDLLLTSPVTATDIAVGKFLAGFGSVAALTAKTACGDRPSTSPPAWNRPPRPGHCASVRTPTGMCAENSGCRSSRRCW